MKKLKAFPDIKSRVFKKPKGKGLRALIERARAIRRQLDEVRPLYMELDEIVLALVDVRDKLPPHGCILFDNYADTNTQFRKPVAISRWILKWTAK